MRSKRRAQDRRSKQPRAITKTQSRAGLPQSERQAELRNKSLRVLREVRRGTSLTAASKQYGISPATVRRCLPSEFRKPRGSRGYVASKADHLVRVLLIVDDRGMVPIRVRGSREATRLGKYLVAVHKAVTNEDPKALADWHGKRIGGRKLITSLRKLMPLAESGSLSFEELYATFSSGAA
jgi:hypothetical protein